jgi:hypothetical protein
MNCRSTQRFRFNQNRAMQQPNSLLHTRKAKTLALQRRIDFETFT